MSRMDEIRAREQAATDGPWWECAIGDGTPENMHHAGMPGGAEVEVFKTPWGAQGVRDMEFIAHARQDIPWLLDRLEAVREFADGLIADGHGVSIYESAAEFGNILTDILDGDA